MLGRTAWSSWTLIDRCKKCPQFLICEDMRHIPATLSGNSIWNDICFYAHSVHVFSQLSDWNNAALESIHILILPSFCPMHSNLLSKDRFIGIVFHAENAKYFQYINSPIVDETDSSFLFDKPFNIGFEVTGDRFVHDSKASLAISIPLRSRAQARRWTRSADR